MLTELSMSCFSGSFPFATHCGPIVPTWLVVFCIIFLAIFSISLVWIANVVPYELWHILDNIGVSCPVVIIHDKEREIYVNVNVFWDVIWASIRFFCKLFSYSSYLFVGGLIDLIQIVKDYCSLLGLFNGVSKWGWYRGV